MADTPGRHGTGPAPAGAASGTGRRRARADAPPAGPPTRKATSPAGRPEHAAAPSGAAVSSGAAAPSGAAVPPDPPALAPIPGSQYHWDARAGSVEEIESELARIWGLAAHEAETSGLTNAAADALGDPRVARRMGHEGDVRVRARTSVLTLVVVAGRPETLERALAAIGELAGRHPSRALILAPADPDGPAALDARLSLECTIRPTSMAETCAERVLVQPRGETAQHLAGIATPLLIHDLPAVLWWTDDPPLGSSQLRELAETCDELLLDSGAFREDGRERLEALAAMIAGGRIAIHDIGWMRLGLWRELLGGLFDHPLLTPELGSLRSVRLDVLRPGKTMRLSKAACFAGWLASALRLDVARPLAPKRNSETLAGAWTDGRREIAVEFRPVPTGGAVAAPANGSLQRVELELGRGRRVVRARVTRQSDHLLATADWDGAEVARRAGTLEPFDEAPYVAETLDRLGRDRMFEDSVARAARLLGS